MVLEDIELNLLSYVSYDFSKKYNILPIRRYNDGVIIICSEIKPQVMSDLKIMFNENVVPYLHAKDTVEENIKHYYEIYNNRQNSPEDFSEDIYEELFKTAIELNVSDIHIEPRSEDVVVRFRYNGELKIFKKLSHSIYNFINTKIKVLSNLDITEKRVSQDGKMIYNYNGKKYNIRVSTLLIAKGEKISLRIHSNIMFNQDINSLGFDEEQVDILKKYLNKKSGMIVVSGPTGSGKSTTLYKFLEYLNNETVSIYTIEDPIEYEIDGINQTLINDKAKLTFQDISKNILRHDPDVLMIGEVRDNQTAKVAVSSSTIGHKVFTTIHARDSISVINRLIDLGISEFLAIDSLNLVISQRLMKKLCKCKKKEKIDDSIVMGETYLTSKYYSPNGCEKCSFTGYNGRILLSEILVIDDIMKDMLLDKKSLKEIRDYIKENYYKYSFQYNLRKFIDEGHIYIKDAQLFR